MVKKILIALDFDHTIIDDNSDTSLYKLAPDKKIPPELKALYHENGWTHYMNEVFKYLHRNNVRKQDILSCLENIPLTEGMNELFSTLPEDLTEYIIISDSNTIFIDHILNHKNIRHKFRNIFTNHGEFGENGLLRINMYHVQNWCDLSTVNLCKGDILASYVASRLNEGVEFPRLAYVGDGFNDFCPCLRLTENDGAFPRIDYKLLKTISKMEKDHHLTIKAKVFPWSTAKDILNVMLPWYSDLNISCSTPRLYDPGPITL
ncbi:UNVERIFIED_CONTAM: hypothetical protein RMT77_012847 [Armadillidium vulgare]